jgi:hypothetical protein
MVRREAGALACMSIGAAEGVGAAEALGAALGAAEATPRALTSVPASITGWTTVGLHEAMMIRMVKRGRSTCLMHPARP